MSDSFNYSLSDVPGATPMDTIPANIESGAGGNTRPPPFFGEIENVRVLIPLLKSITIKRIAVMAITERGLKITCEEVSRSVQASAFIDKNLFKRYDLPDNSTKSLAFRMSDLLTALNILFPEPHKSDDPLFDTTKNALQIKFPAYKEGHCEQLKLQVITDHHEAAASINTYDPESLVVFSMAFINKIILDASVLIEFWKCADSSSSHIVIGISNTDDAFEMSTKSDRGSFLQRIDPESSHIEHYECTVPMSNHYLMEHMKSTLRPLLLATKVSVRTDQQGLLNMQFLIRLEGNVGVDTTTSVGGGGGGGAANRSSLPSQESSFSDADINDEVPKCFVEFYILPTVEAS